MRRGALVAAILTSCVATAVPAESCTFYVRAGFVPAAGLIADGAAPRTAFPTIRDAAQALRNWGDVVCVGPGEYVEGDITPRRSGIADQPIVFRADPSGQSTQDPAGSVRVISPPPSGASPAAGFRLLGQSYIVIEGFDLEGYEDPAIQVRSAADAPTNSSNITIRNNTVRQVARTGIDVSAEGEIIVEGNQVMGAGGSGISVQSCVGALPFGDPNAAPRCRGGPSEEVEPIIDSNRVGVSIGHGIFVQDASDGVVQNNVVYSNELTGITLRSAPDFVVANNLVYGNGEQGLAVGTNDLPSPRVTVGNNTFYDNLAWGILIGSGNVASEGAMVVNNILMLNGRGAQGIAVSNEAGLDPRTTCGYLAGFNVTADAYGLDTPYNVYDVTGDPLFAGPIAGIDGILGGYRDGSQIVDGSGDDNFTLRQPGSPPVSRAVNAGFAPVDEVGILGSTAPDGTPDTGVLDAGFHYGVEPGLALSFPTPFMPVYVRLGGSNSNNGKTAAAPIANIKVAALRARAGVTIVVGPGVYRECSIKPPADQGRAAFQADPEGALTGDAPGHVVVDAGCCTTTAVGNHCVPGDDGFNIPSSCNVVVDGFHVRGAHESGIMIQRGSHGAEVRNNVTFTNDRRGIGVVDAHDVRIFNNLVYDNLFGGIQVGGGVCREGSDCSVLGSRRALVENNTCYSNGENGVLIGSGPGHSTYATVRYNILHVGGGEGLPPGRNGIQLGSSTTLEDHLEGYAAYFNINYQGLYGGSTPRPPSDREDDPLFVHPAGSDGVLGGSGFADDRFHLSQRGAGQLRDSPGVNVADITAEAQMIDARTTRTDLVTDHDALDLGYHYPLYVPRVVGDCNDDGIVTVSELLRAVNIALGRTPLERCLNVDANGDGSVSISELTLAVRSALFNFR